MKIAHKHGSGEMDSLPGCHQVAVIHSAFVEVDKRNKGHGKTYNDERLECCKNFKYDIAICTVDLANKAQLKVLKYNGWILLTKFKNRKTGHTIGICAHGIDQKLDHVCAFPLLYDVSQAEIYYSDYEHPDGLR